MESQGWNLKTYFYKWKTLRLIIHILPFVVSVFSPTLFVAPEIR